MIKQVKKNLFALLVPVFLLALPGSSQAGGLGSARDELREAAGSSYGVSGGAADLPVFIGEIIGSVLGLVGVILVVLLVYGGFLWLTAGGNSEQVDKAKKIIVNGVIGLIIVMSAYSISYFVVERITASTLSSGSS